MRLERGLCLKQRLPLPSFVSAALRVSFSDQLRTLCFFTVSDWRIILTRQFVLIKPIIHSCSTVECALGTSYQRLNICLKKIFFYYFFLNFAKYYEDPEKRNLVSLDVFFIMWV